MNQVLGKLSDGGVSIVKGSNQLVISCQIPVISPFQVTEE